MCARTHGRSCALLGSNQRLEYRVKAAVLHFAAQARCTTVLQECHNTENGKKSAILTPSTPQLGFAVAFDRLVKIPHSYVLGVGCVERRRLAESTGTSSGNDWQLWKSRRQREMEVKISARRSSAGVLGV